MPFVLESVADAPRAPWWNTEPNPPASLNPTASVASLLHRLGVAHPWLESATDFVWETLESLSKADPHTLLGVPVFLAGVPERSRAKAAFARLADQVVQCMALGLGAEGYVHPPTAFAPTPESLAAQLYAPELMARHLDALAQRQ